MCEIAGRRTFLEGIRFGLLLGYGIHVHLLNSIFLKIQICCITCKYAVRKFPTSGPENAAASTKARSTWDRTIKEVLP